MKIILLTLLFVIFLGPSVRAQESHFCDELKNPEIYKKDKSFKNIVGGGEGWIFRTNSDFKEGFLIRDEALRGMISLNKSLKDKNINLVLAIPPTRGHFYGGYANYSSYNIEKSRSSYLTLIEKLRNAGIAVSSYDRFDDKDFFYKQDHHWSAEGARKMAQSVSLEIKKLPNYKLIDKVEYQTEYVEDQDHIGSLAKFVNKNCGSNITEEQAKIFKTFSNDNNFFGDIKEAEIILLGTSNSVQENSKANFDGFLKQYISADVSNLAVSGGGFDTSILQWLTSEAYEINKPKIVIWEFPSYQNYFNLNFYKQVMPAVYGDCNESAIYQGNIKTKNNISEVLFTKPVKAKNHYVVTNAPDFKGKRFKILSKNKEEVVTATEIKISDSYETNGRFYADISSDKAIDSIKFIFSENAKLSGELKVCEYP